jgi:hypothetical protein
MIAAAAKSGGDLSPAQMKRLQVHRYSSVLPHCHDLKPCRCCHVIDQA